MNNALQCEEESRDASAAKFFSSEKQQIARSPSEEVELVSKFAVVRFPDSCDLHIHHCLLFLHW